jgi:hypothetical protein
MKCLKDITDAHSLLQKEEDKTKDAATVIKTL